MKVNLLVVGLALILIGILIVIFSSLSGTEKYETKIAVGGFVGPIPFGWANDPKMFKWILVLIAAVAALFFFMK